MARPRKNNADYFSHDNDMRNDDKILSVRRKFWHEWYSVWNMLLEKLCKSTWFIIDVDNVSIELLSWDFFVEPEKLMEIIDYFIYIRLISREWDRIYSQKMIDRFEWLLSKRQRDIEYRKWKPKDEIVIDVEKPQSKVKQSKVNNIINNITIEKAIETRNNIDWFKSTRKITDEIKKQWDKIQKTYTTEECEIAINNYYDDTISRKKTNDTNWYDKHRFTFYEFIKQDNWLQKWINK